MSFRGLTSGERKRLQSGILSAEEATKVAIRAREKEASQPSVLEKIEGAVRIVAKGVAGVYTGGLAIPVINALENVIPRATPEQQLFGQRVHAAAPVAAGAPMASYFGNGTYGNGGQIPSMTTGADWLGSIARITESIAPAFYGGARRAIGPDTPENYPTGYPSAAPRALPGPAGPVMAGIVRVILYKIRNNLGRAISLSGIAALVRRLGPAATAIGLGIAVDELATLIFHHEARKARRRRRGISARDITRARSTITRMTRFMGRVQEACAPVGHVRHRRRLHRPGCGCVVCRRAA